MKQDNRLLNLENEIIIIKSMELDPLNLLQNRLSQLLEK